MQLNDLFAVTDYLVSINKKHNYAGLFNQVSSTLQQLTQNSNQPKFHNQLIDSRKKLMSALKEMSPDNWSFVRTKLFRSFCKEDYYGEHVIERIQDAFQENQANPAGMKQKIDEINKEVTDIFNRAAQLGSSLRPLLEKYVDVPDLEEDEYSLQILFDHDIPVENIDELAKHSKKWKDVFYLYGRAIGEVSHEPRILTVEKGSFFIEIAAYKEVVTAIGLTIGTVLLLAKEYYKVKKLSLETENLELDVEMKKSFKEKYEQACDQIEESAVEKVVSEVKEKYFPDDPDASREKSIEKAVKYLFQFILKGGEIDVREPDVEEVDDEAEDIDEENEDSTVQEGLELEEIKQLKSRISEVRKLAQEFGELPRLELFEDDDSSDDEE